MALNIPMPQFPGDALFSGLRAGGNLFNNMMNPVIARQQMAQQQKQADYNNWLHGEQLKVNQQKLAQMQQQGQQKNALDPLKKMILEQRLHNLQNQQQGQQKNALDPLKKMILEQRLHNLQNQQQGQQENALDPLKKMILEQRLHNLQNQTTQTPEQKNQGFVDRAVAIDDAKAKRKKMDEIEASAKTLFPFAQNVNTLKDLLQKNPDLTGKSTKLAQTLGLTQDEDVGEFASASLNLQAKMAKMLSKVGGYGVANIVERAKPDIGHSGAFNKGALKDLGKDMQTSFQQMEKEYQKLGGKELPVEYKKLFEEEVEDAISNAALQENTAPKKRLKYNLSTGELE